MNQFDTVLNNFQVSLKESSEILSQLLRKSSEEDVQKMIAAVAELAAKNGNIEGLDPQTRQILLKLDQKPSDGFSKLSSTSTPQISAASGTTQPVKKTTIISPQTPTSTTINPQYPS